MRMTTGNVDLFCTVIDSLDLLNEGKPSYRHERRSDLTWLTTCAPGQMSFGHACNDGMIRLALCSLMKQ